MKHQFTASVADSERCATCSNFRGHPDHYVAFDFTTTRTSHGDMDAWGKPPKSALVKEPKKARDGK